MVLRKGKKFGQKTNKTIKVDPNSHIKEFLQDEFEKQCKSDQPEVVNCKQVKETDSVYGIVAKSVTYEVVDKKA